MSVQQPRNPEDLSTSLPLLLPPLLLSLLTGVLIEVQPWLGCSIVLVVVEVLVATRRIVKAKKVNVKIIEVALLAVLIPVLATASVFAHIAFPIAANTLNLMLLSTAAHHLPLLWRMRTKLNYPTVIVGSVLLLITAIALRSCALQYPSQSFGPTLPTGTVVIYSVAILFGAAFHLRDKFGITAMRWISFIAATISFAAWIASALLAEHLYYALLTATIVFTLIHVVFDCMHRQERLRGIVLSMQLCGALVVICSYILGIFTRIAYLPQKDDRVFLLLFFLIGMLFVHAAFHVMIGAVRDEDPTLPDSQPLTKSAAAGIAAMSVVIDLMCSIGYFYCTATQPAVVHDKYLLTVIAVLYLLLTYLFERNAAFLNQYYWRLLGLSIGVVIYFIVYGIFRERSIAPGVSPIAKVAIVTVFLCLNLIAYFACAIGMQDFKKENTPTAPAVRISAAPVAIPLPVVQRDVDSDYDSDEDREDNVAQAAV